MEEVMYIMIYKTDMQFSRRKSKSNLIGKLSSLYIGRGDILCKRTASRPTRLGRGAVEITTGFVSSHQPLIVVKDSCHFELDSKNNSGYQEEMDAKAEKFVRKGHSFDVPHVICKLVFLGSIFLGEERQASVWGTSS